MRSTRNPAARRSPTTPPGCSPATGSSALCTNATSSGRGHRVDVNMLESGIAFIPDPFANYTRAGIKSDRLTRVAASQSFAFRCGDGKLIAVHLSSQPKFFEGMAAALERPDLVRDERFATRDLRIKNYGELTRVLAEIVATKPRAHWVNRLEENDVPFAPVNSIEDVLDDPQVRHLRTFYRQRSEEHTSELQSLRHLVCRLLLEKKKKTKIHKTQDKKNNSTYREKKR